MSLKKSFSNLILQKKSECQKQSGSWILINIDLYLLIEKLFLTKIKSEN